MCLSLWRLAKVENRIDSAILCSSCFLLNIIERTNNVPSSLSDFSVSMVEYPLELCTMGNLKAFASQKQIVKQQIVVCLLLADSWIKETLDGICRGITDFSTIPAPLKSSITKSLRSLRELEDLITEHVPIASFAAFATSFEGEDNARLKSLPKDPAKIKSVNDILQPFEPAVFNLLSCIDFKEIKESNLNDARFLLLTLKAFLEEKRSSSGRAGNDERSSASLLRFRHGVAAVPGLLTKCHETLMVDDEDIDPADFVNNHLPEVFRILLDITACITGIFLKDKALRPLCLEFCCAFDPENDATEDNESGALSAAFLKLSACAQDLEMWSFGSILVLLEILDHLKTLRGEDMSGELNEALFKLAYNVLENKSGEEENPAVVKKSILHTVSILLKTSPHFLKTVKLLITNMEALDTVGGDAPVTLSSLNAKSRASYLTALLKALVNAYCAPGPRTDFATLETYVKTFGSLVHQSLSFKGLFHALMRSGIRFIAAFQRRGLKDMQKKLSSKKHRPVIIRILKSLQRATRELQQLCSHVKIEKNNALTRLVPSLKKCLESFVFSVKMMLGTENRLSAFNIGTLKHRQLDGQAVCSQAYVEKSESEPERETQDDDEGNPDQEEEGAGSPGAEGDAEEEEEELGVNLEESDGGNSIDLENENQESEDEAEIELSPLPSTHTKRSLIDLFDEEAGSGSEEEYESMKRSKQPKRRSR